MDNKQFIYINNYGTKFYYIKNSVDDIFYHRTDGPAIEYVNGDKHWYLNDKLHRSDGPAIEYEGGGKEWYINGKQYFEKEYWRLIKLATFI